MSTDGPFDANRDVILALIRSLCQRNSLSPGPAKRFESFVEAQLRADDQRILRRFSGTPIPKLSLKKVVQSLYETWCRSTAQETDDPYREHSNLIDATVTAFCRWKALSPDESQDFASHVNEKLLEDDRRRLRLYKGRGSFKGFLRVLVTRLWIGMLIARHGRYRPPAPVKRLGPVAVKLHKLLHFRGFTLNEAIEYLKLDPAVKLSEKELYSIAAKLPPKSPRLKVSEDALASAKVDRPSPEDLAIQKESRSKQRKVERVINSELAKLGEEDRLFFRLDRVSGIKVSEIAKLLGREAPPLYKRRRKIWNNMKKALLKEGITEDDLEGILAGGDLSFDFSVGENESEAEKNDENEEKPGKN